MTARVYCVCPFSEFQGASSKKNKYERRALPVIFFSYSSLQCVEVPEARAVIVPIPCAPVCTHPQYERGEDGCAVPPACQSHPTSEAGRGELICHSGGSQAVPPLNGRTDNVAFVLAGAAECHPVQNNSGPCRRY